MWDSEPDTILLRLGDIVKLITNECIALCQPTNIYIYLHEWVKQHKWTISFVEAANVNVRLFNSQHVVALFKCRHCYIDWHISIECTHNYMTSKSRAGLTDMQNCVQKIRDRRQEQRYQSSSKHFSRTQWWNTTIIRFIEKDELQTKGAS